MKPLPFTIWEQSAMHQLGLADRDDMRSLREQLLLPEVDWTKLGQRIMLTAAALEKLERHLQAFPYQVAVQGGAIAEAVSAVKTAPAEPAKKKPAALIRLCVLPLKPVNPHILMCRVPEKIPSDRSGWVRVRVKNSANFRAPPCETGEILARLVEGDLYEFAGNPRSEKNDIPRCPRWVGRW